MQNLYKCVKTKLHKILFLQLQIAINKELKLDITISYNASKECKKASKQTNPLFRTNGFLDSNDPFDTRGKRAT